MTPQSSRLPARTVASYAVMGVPLALFIPPFPAIIAAFYAQHTAATTAGIGVAFLVARLIDAFTDPPMGHLSDSTKSPWGPRKPYVVGGVLIGALAIFIFFNPPADAGNMFYLVASIGFYLALTIFNIPLRAWAGELSTDYAERNRIAMYLSIALLLSGLVFVFLPVVLSLPQIGLLETSEFNRETFTVMSIVALIVFPICALVAITSVPKGQVHPGDTPSIFKAMVEVRHNRPFLIMTAAEVCNYLASGIVYSVLILALSSYFGFGALIPLFMVIVIAAQTLSMGVARSLANRMGKHRVWAWGVVLQALLLPAFFLFEAGQTTFVMIAIYSALFAILQAPHFMVPMAMLNDIADHELDRSGQNKAGCFFALQNLIQKGGNAVGYAIGYLILSWVGYDPKLEANTEFAVLGLKANIVVLPMIFLLLCGFFLFRYPLTEKVMGEIQERLKTRSAAT